MEKQRLATIVYQKALSSLEAQESGVVLKHTTRIILILACTLFACFPGFFLLVYAELIQITGGFLLLFPLALFVYFYRARFSTLYREFTGNLQSIWQRRESREDQEEEESETLVDYLVQHRTVTIKVLREQFAFSFQKANELLRALESAGLMVKNKDHGNARMLRENIGHDEIDLALENWGNNQDLTLRINTTPAGPVFSIREIA